MLVEAIDRGVLASPMQAAYFEELDPRRAAK
jgi:hypothetical protein